MSAGCEIHLTVQALHSPTVPSSAPSNAIVTEEGSRKKEETERKWHTGQSFSISLPISCVITAAFDGLLTAGTFL